MSDRFCRLLWRPWVRPVPRLPVAIVCSVWLAALWLAGCATTLKQQILQPGEVYASQPIAPLQPADSQSIELPLPPSADQPKANAFADLPLADALLLENEFRMRRDPQSINFMQCAKVARARQDYELTSRCLAQARALRDLSADLAMAGLLVELAPERGESSMELALSHINAQHYGKALDVLVQSEAKGFAVDLADPAIRAVFLYGDDVQSLLNKYRAYRTTMPEHQRLLLGEAVLLNRKMEQYYFIGKYRQSLSTTDEIFAMANSRQLQNAHLDLERVHITRARSLDMLGQTDQAIASLEKAVAGHTNYPAASLALVGFYLKAGRNAQVGRLVSGLLQAYPHSNEMYLRIGLLAVDSNLPKIQTKVRNYFGQKSRQSKSPAERELAMYHLSQLSGAAGSTQARLAYLAQIHETDSLVLQAVHEQAALIDTTRGKEAARNFYQQQEAQHPNLALQIQLSRAYWMADYDRNQAVDYVTGLLNQRGENQELYYARGFLYALEGKISPMEMDFRKILAVNPMHADTLNAYGYTLVDQTNRINQGLALISRAFSIDSERPAIVDSLAWAYFRSGQTRRSLVLIQWAYARSQDPEIAAHYGEILWTLGYTDEANALLERDRQEHPENQVLQDTWQRLFGRQ